MRTVRAYHIGPASFGVFTGEYQLIYAKDMGSYTKEYSCNNPSRTSPYKNNDGFQYVEFNLTQDEFVNQFIIYLFI